MDQNVIEQVKQAIIYLIVFTASICILLHFYIFPSIKKALFSGGSSIDLKKIGKNNVKWQMPNKRNDGKE